jgi:FtsH-binding integral membrane protein
MPYLGIVVSLGYLRQSLAISFLAISLYYFLRNKEIKSFLFMILSFLSHLVVAPYLLIFSMLKKNRKLIFPVFFFIVLIILFIAFDKVENYFYYYLGDGIHFTSKGAVARVTLNIPFFIIFYIYKFEKKLSQNENFFFILSFIILITCLILIFTGRSTIADRIGIQLILFQGYVIGKLYEHFNEVLIKKLYVFLVLSYSCIVFYGWKMLSNYSNDWFPYKNIIFSTF